MVDNLRSLFTEYFYPIDKVNRDKIFCQRPKLKMSSLNKFTKYLAIPAIAMLLLLPVVISAQLAPTVPTVPGTTLTQIEGYINRIAQFFLVIGVILAIAYIIYGGITWMNAGGDDTKIKTAKTRIWSGVYGALIVLAVGLILQTLAGVVTRIFFQ